MIAGITASVLAAAATPTDTGWSFVQLGTPEGGGGGFAWSSASNVTANDGSNATCNVDGGEDSDFIHGEMGSRYFSIPIGSTIDGIEVEYEASSADGDISEKQLYIVIGGVRSTVVNRSTTATYTGTMTAYTRGGSTDKWGLTTPIPVGDMNATDFGFALLVTNDASKGDDTVSVDYMKVKVHYTP